MSESSTARAAAAATVRPPTTFMEKHRFKLSLVLLVCSAIFGCTSLLPTFALLVVADRASRFGATGVAVGALQVASQSASNIASGFYTIVAFLLRRVCGIDVEVTAIVPGAYAQYNIRNGLSVAMLIKPPPAGKSSIIICNHRTRLDWMLMWMVLVQSPGALHALRIVLKDELSRLPFFGWAMQYFRFIFMTRKFATDEARIGAAATAFRVLRDSNLILIFPEGTDLHDKAIVKSNEYAAANKVPEYKYVLHPRETGLLTLISQLGAENIHEVIDLTMGYEDYDPAGERPSEQTFFRGRMTRKLNVLVEVFRFRELPAKQQKADVPIFYTGDALPLTSPELVKKWLKDQFARKEDYLTRYYSLPRKPAGKGSFSWMDVGYDMKLAVEANRFPTQERSFLRMVPPIPSIKSDFLIPVGWALGFLWLMYTLFTVSVFRWVFLLMVVGYVVETKYFVGIDHMLIFPTAARCWRSLTAKKNGAPIEKKV